MPAVTKNFLLAQRRFGSGRWNGLRQSRGHDSLSFNFAVPISSFSAAGDGGHDADRVALLHGSFFSLQIANVLIVDVDVDEAAQAAIVGVQMLLQVAELRRERIQCVADGAGFEIDALVLTGELPERRRD